MKKISRLLLAAVLSMVSVVSAYAQLTTSSVSGKIVDTKGEALVGAAVIAVHTPSGSQYYAVANEGGYYTIQGMRPGGPYEVTVSLLGSKTLKVTDLNLPLGETVQFDATLQDESEQLSESVVTASASKFSAEKTGASLNISNNEIANLPSVNRSIQDIAKLSPYANGMSFAGSDGRSTNFTVDGANFNNNFGLSSNLPGGGTPISVDALEEVQVVVAPYDVRQSNFVGGGINAITKSGTNTFKGTAYAYYTNQDLRGNKIAGKDLGDRPFQQRQVYGATIGGPIVKNKLFFFANIEWQKDSEQTIKYRAAKAGETPGGLISQVTEEEMQKAYNHLLNDYGYNPGSYTDYPGGVDNLKVLARIDWNISDAHKLSVRYNLTKNTTWREPNGNSCDDAYRNKSYNRVGETSMAFSNNMYGEMNNVWSIAAELNSRFSEKFSNQFIFTYTNINDMRMSNSAEFPQIDIMRGDAGNKSIPHMSAGYELFTYNNGVKNSVFTAADNATFYLGAHKLTAGIGWERQNAQNSYMRNGTGYYRWATLDDFLNNNTPMSVCVTVGANGVAAPVGQITYNKVGVYVQDEWAITKQFKLTYGLRVDEIFFNEDQLMRNNSFLAYEMGDNVLNTGRWPHSVPQFSPRVGFNWDPVGDKSVIIRGGVGLFQGRLPLVFFTNMPQNAGMIQISKNVSGNTPENIALIEKLKNPTTGLYETDAAKIAQILGVNTTVTPESGSWSSTLNGVDRNFKMPQLAKASLAIDYTVPVNFPFVITTEGMFSKTIYGVRLTDWAINEDVVRTQSFEGVDNRFDYWKNETVSADGSKISDKQYVYKTPAGDHNANAYVLTNTSKGYGWNAAISFKMKPARNLDINASYVHTASYEISGMPGSNASSAYSGLYTVNGCNFANLQCSQYVVPDKVLVNIGYFIPMKAFHGNGMHLNLFYTAYSAGGYSYAYANDMNGDGNNADLMYIYPNGASVPFVEHKYADGTTLTVKQQQVAYDNFISQDKYLSSHKGQYAGANAARSPWVHRIDFRLAQDFAFKVGNTIQKFQLSVSLENIANMINSEWGVQKWSCYQTSSSIYAITPLTFDYAAYKSSGKPAYYMTPLNSKTSEMPTQTFSKFYTDPTQCFRVLFGLKYFFN